MNRFSKGVITYSMMCVSVQASLKRDLMSQKKWLMTLGMQNGKWDTKMVGQRTDIKAATKCQ